MRIRHRVRMCPSVRTPGRSRARTRSPGSSARAPRAGAARSTGPQVILVEPRIGDVDLVQRQGVHVCAEAFILLLRCARAAIRERWPPNSRTRVPTVHSIRLRIDWVARETAKCAGKGVLDKGGCSSDLPGPRTRHTGLPRESRGTSAPKGSARRKTVTDPGRFQRPDRIPRQSAPWRFTKSTRSSAGHQRGAHRGGGLRTPSRDHRSSRRVTVYGPRPR